ncbi:Nif3-like dinuclear metal center hexameric protein [Desulforudis sp. 1088]|uniref:Nif3-like dinuclear metal center hexameric protein n=1 Tax=unclassified Candidatus Desulforudis TaxID=2635950 RepID=UPI003492D55E
MSAKCASIVTFIEELAPKTLAMEGDNTGWQLGDPKAAVSKVLLTLDIDERTVEEAVRIGAQLIVSHHPLFHRPFKNLRLDLPAGALVARLVRENINVYSAHTNLDAAEEGVNAVLAKGLGLVDSVPLTDDPPGFGRIGRLPEPQSFYSFVADVKTVLELPAVRAGGPQDRIVKKVALCGGSGGDLWSKAAFAGADVFVTGDIKYHVAQDILAAGMNFVDPGHYPSERVILEPLKDHLEKRCRASRLDVEFVVSTTGRDPFMYL